MVGLGVADGGRSLQRMGRAERRGLARSGCQAADTGGHGGRRHCLLRALGRGAWRAADPARQPSIGVGGGHPEGRYVGYSQARPGSAGSCTSRARRYELVDAFGGVRLNT